MDKKDLRIVYMGTPDFAVESLKALVEGGYNVVGVITMPDKAVGKSHSVLTPSPVKKYALSQNIPLLQPEKLKDIQFLSDLKALEADLQIVVAFRMLPEVVWDMPRYGTFNLHASLLPQYRGAAPINWAVINGETETGITTFFLTHEIDTGRIIEQEKVSINDADDAGVIHDRLMALGAELVVKTVDQVLNDSIQTIEQEDILKGKEPKLAPKIFKETCKIDWNKDVKQIYDFIRGLSPYPAAWAELQAPNGELLQLKIFETEKIFSEHNHPSGTMLSDGKTFIDVAVNDGFIRLLSIQQAGKKRMSVTEFLRGSRFMGASL